MKPIQKYLLKAASVAAITTAANAATVTYDFDSGLGDSTSGSDLTAGAVSYAVGTQSDGAPDSSERAWDQTSASGDYLLNFGQRGLGNSGVADANLTTTAAATLQFTLAPNAGQSLDFTTATIGFDHTSYADSGNVNFAYKVWADTGSGFVAVGALQTTGTFTYVSGTEAILLETDESTALTGFSLTGGTIQSQDTAFSFDISSLGALADDQAVTFALAISTDRNNQFGLGNGFDNLEVSGITAVPEPSSAALLGLGGLGLILRRRK